MSSERPVVSVAITTFNESGSIHRLLKSLEVQTRPPDEVVLCDGGSTDDTVERIRAYATTSEMSLRLIVSPGANISRGRNVAIQAAQGDVVAVTDAGVRLIPGWLEEITAPFDDESVQAVAGYFVPDPWSAFEMAMGATVIPEIGEIDVEHFLPSSRSVAFRKSVWETVGGYPEWLDYCEDLVFDYYVRDRYGPFTFAPRALVYFRPRPNLRAFWQQYYRYARGDGKADLWRQRHAIRYGVYLVSVPAIAALGALVSPWIGCLYLLSIPAMFLRGWQRLAHRWEPLALPQKLVAFALVPVIRVVGDLAKMAGYPAGLLWRWRHRRDEELRWRDDLLHSLGPASAGSSRRWLSQD